MAVGGRSIWENTEDGHGRIVTAYAVSNTFAGASGNVAASQLDTNFTTLVNGLNNVFLVGTLAARPAPDGVGNGRYYLATDTNGGTFYRDNGTAWVQVAAGITQVTTWTDQLTGLTLSNDGVSPNTVLDIAVGGAASDDAVLSSRIFMSLTSAFTKTTGAWAVGTGNGALDTGAIGAAAWYHVFLIQRTDTNVVDVLFSLSATAPTMPANYTKKRRIGSFLTAASNIVAFTQDGDLFQWNVPPALDFNTNNPGITAVTQLVSVPTGVRVIALINVEGVDTAGTTRAVLFSDLAVADTAPSLTVTPLYNFALAPVANIDNAALVAIHTNTSGQVRYRAITSGATFTIRGVAIGWYDRRGRG